MTEVSPKGLAVVRSFEGRALKAYRDSVGVITVGYGNTNYDAFAKAYLGGPITMATTITEEQAEFLLVQSLSKNYAPAVNKAMPGASQQAIDAGASFHYNTGAIARAGWVKHWKASAPALTIKAALNSWNKAGGKVLAGLVRRRAREGAILIDGDYGPEGRTRPPTIGANGRVSGKVPPVTSPDHPFSGTPGMMKLDDVGPHVADYIDSLIAIGFKLPKGETFTLAVKKATEDFQTAHPGLTVDGVAGPATRAQVGREADLKRKMATAAGTAGGAGGLGGVAEAASFHLPGSVWVTLAVVTVIAIGWIAYRYRDEVIGLANRVRS